MTQDRSGIRPSAATYAGLFLVTLSTLMYELVLTRIFSVTMWYHFAFVAISVALFGMTVGALLVHLLPHRFKEEDVDRQLWLYSLLFGVTLALSFLTQLSVPFIAKATIAGFWSMTVICSVISVPFICSGIVVCLALTRFPSRVNRLYAADLVGAAIGCVALLVVFTWFDGPSVVILTGALGALGALVFALKGRQPRRLVLSGVALLALGSFALTNGYMYHSSNDAPLRIVWAKEVHEDRPLQERWNVFSRLTVNGDPNQLGAPAGYGMSTTLPPSMQVNQLGMVIDSTAGTPLTRYSGDPRQTDFLQYDITNLAHYAKKNANVLVVGVGGGRDILSALEFDQRHVTGVEINGDILDLTNKTYGDFTGHLDRNPKVTFVNDEARSWVTRTKDRFDMIQISLIDTWAATSSGAYALSENSLYTTQAFNTFYNRLKPGGIFSVSRWYSIGNSDKPLEIYRTTALAAQVLTDRGVKNPRDHILIYHGPKFGFGNSAATVLMSPQGFSKAELATIEAQAARLQFVPVLTPETAIDQHFADLVKPGGPGKAVSAFTEDIRPPTDDRPFFFQMADLNTLTSKAGLKNNQAIRPVLVLAMLGLIVLVMAACCIALPLVLDRKNRQVPHRQMAPFYLYFAGIGFGFLLIEVAQLQRLNIFLGHPIYGLGVVLFSVLLFSGIGSMLVERVVRGDRPSSRLAPLGVLLAVVIVMGIATPRVIDAMDGATTPIRILTAVALLIPLGLVMGMPFSIGMGAAASRPGAPTAFLWGINGATSVCASVFGVVIAVFWGIGMAYWAGFLAYALSFLAMMRVSRRQPPEPLPEEPPEPVQREEEPALSGVAGG